mmetsp:Transcript_34521/g.98818  ORF Transcript_34521/g.98818 Transcript_34521/m.98818 type:complete len:255 (+) Transcript_34521:498-1262(+)
MPQRRQLSSSDSGVITTRSVRGTQGWSLLRFCARFVQLERSCWSRAASDPRQREPGGAARLGSGKRLANSATKSSSAFLGPSSLPASKAVLANTLWSISASAICESQTSAPAAARGPGFSAAAPGSAVAIRVARFSWSSWAMSALDVAATLRPTPLASWIHCATASAVRGLTSIWLRFSLGALPSERASQSDRLPHSVEGKLSMPQAVHADAYRTQSIVAVRMPLELLPCALRIASATRSKSGAKCWQWGHQGM